MSSENVAKSIYLSNADSKAKLLQAALDYFHQGYRVVPVCNDKTPIIKGWNLPYPPDNRDEEFWPDEWNDLYFPKQSENSIRRHFSLDYVRKEDESRRYAWGVGIVNYPITRLITLDLDGEHSRDTWERKGVPLTKTTVEKTRSGGWHIHYLAPETKEKFENVKRSIRLIEAPPHICDCKYASGKPHPCGIDLLVRGQVVVAPSPGYELKTGFDKIAPVPEALWEMALEKHNAKDTSFCAKPYRSHPEYSRITEDWVCANYIVRNITRRSDGLDIKVDCNKHPSDPGNATWYLYTEPSKNHYWCFGDCALIEGRKASFYERVRQQQKANSKTNFYGKVSQWLNK